jgi:hypothetical protein
MEEKAMNEVIRHVLSAARGIAALRGRLGARPAASPVISGVRLIGAGGAVE